MRVKPIFRWFDLWIGFYIDTKGDAVYILPIPMLGIKITFPNTHYLIIGKYINAPIGCCSGVGKKDVLEEEPGATFKRITRKKCPICKEV